MCEKGNTCHDGTVQLVVGGQSSSSFVPSVIKTDVPLDSDDRVHKDFLLQKYGERSEKLSQQARGDGGIESSPVNNNECVRRDVDWLWSYDAQTDQMGSVHMELPTLAPRLES